MGVSPQQWADCAEAFIRVGNHLKARELLEEYFHEHARKVTSYACYETAPMRVLAKLLIQSGDFVRAVEFGRLAYLRKHQSPMDTLIYALALEPSGDSPDACRICAEAMRINDQMPGVKELNQRLAG